VDECLTVLSESNCTAALHEEYRIKMSLRFRYDYMVAELFIRQKDSLLKPKRGR